MNRPKGLTLIEIVLVMIIVAIGASAAVVSMRAGFENRQARQVAETAKSIAHSVRMYQVDTGNLPGTNLSELFNQGYLKREELAFGNNYAYSFVPNAQTPSQWRVQASSNNPNRTLSVTNRGSSLEVSDSKGFLKT